MKTKELYWYASIPAAILNQGYIWNKLFKLERQAAIAVDRKLIEVGRWPVNILKRKELTALRHE
jgi:hypothetical protein